MNQASTYVSAYQMQCSDWPLQLFYFSYYYYRKTCSAVYQVPRYLFAVFTVEERLSTTHHYCKRNSIEYVTLLVNNTTEGVVDDFGSGVLSRVENYPFILQEWLYDIFCA